MCFEVGVGGFEDAFVLIVKVNDASELLVSGRIDLFDFCAIKDNFFDKDFSKIFEKLKFFFLGDDLGSLIELLKPSVDTIINNILNSILKESVKLSISQAINVLEPLVNKGPQNSGLVDNVLESLGLVELDKFVFMLVVDFFSQSMNVITLVSVVDFIGFEPASHFRVLVLEVSVIEELLVYCETSTVWDGHVLGCGEQGVAGHLALQLFGLTFGRAEVLLQDLLNRKGLQLVRRKVVHQNVLAA